MFTSTCKFQNDLQILNRHGDACIMDKLHHTCVHVIASHISIHRTKLTLTKFGIDMQDIMDSALVRGCLPHFGEYDRDGLSQVSSIAYTHPHYNPPRERKIR